MVVLLTAARDTGTHSQRQQERDRDRERHEQPCCFAKFASYRCILLVFRSTPGFHDYILGVALA